MPSPAWRSAASWCSPRPPVPISHQQCLGGPGTRWFTEIIYQWFYEGQDWPQGAAYAFLLLILCLGFVLAMMRLFKVGLADIAK